MGDEPVDARGDPGVLPVVDGRRGRRRPDASQVLDVLHDGHDGNQVARLGAVDVPLRVGPAALPQVQAQQMRLALAEDELDALGLDEARAHLAELLVDGTAAKMRHDHAALAHDHGLGGQLREEGRELVALDLPLREAVAAPAEAVGGDHLALRRRVEDQRPLVLGLHQQAALVVGRRPVAAHLLHVHLVAEPIDGELLLLGLGHVEAFPDHGPLLRDRILRRLVHAELPRPSAPNSDEGQVSAACQRHSPPRTRRRATTGFRRRESRIVGIANEQTCVPFWGREALLPAPEGPGWRR